jgi:hypothetical protein
MQLKQSTTASECTSPKEPEPPILPPNDGCAAALAILQQAPVYKPSSPSADHPDEDGPAKLERLSERLVCQVQRYGYRSKPGNQAKWEREEEASSLARQLLKCDSWQAAYCIFEGVSPDVWTELELSPDEFKELVSSPDQAAHLIEQSLQDLRQSGYYGRDGEKGKTRRLVNKGGRSMDAELLMLLADAVEIFEEWTSRRPTVTEGSWGISFLEEVTVAAGYHRSSTRPYLVHILKHLKEADTQPEYVDTLKWFDTKSV